MSRILILISLLGLSACGFSPLHGTYSNNNDLNAQALFNYIEIANIPDREGQELRNNLIDRLYSQGYPTDPAYTLNISTIDESLQDLDLTRASDSTRGQLRLNTMLRLTDNKTQDVLLQRNLRSITSYNILDSEFSTRISEHNARSNALNDLARQVEQQLALYFSREYKK